MLARSLCSLSKGAVRTTALLPQIPAMHFATDLKVSNDKKAVRYTRGWLFSLAQLQTVLHFPL